MGRPETIARIERNRRKLEAEKQRRHEIRIAEMPKRVVIVQSTSYFRSVLKLAIVITILLIIAAYAGGKGG